MMKIRSGRFLAIQFVMSSCTCVVRDHSYARLKIAFVLILAEGINQQEQRGLIFIKNIVDIYLLL
jgi:hypothetical protein